MKLLSAARLRVCPPLPGPRAATAGYALLLVLLEVSGRAARSDLHDLLAGLLLVLATYALAAWHRRDPIGWVGWAGRRLRGLPRGLRGWRVEWGLDLRGTPPLPGRLPRPVWGLAVGGAAAAGLAELLWQLAPAGWRTLGVRTLYLPYLVAVLGVWAALLGLAVAGVGVPLWALDRRLGGRLRAAGRRPLVSLGLTAYLFAVAAAATVLPAAVPLGLAAGAAAGGFGLAARVPAGRPGVLWRRRRRVQSVPGRRLAGFAVGVAGVWVFALLHLACGGRLLGLLPAAADPMPWTGLLGAFAAWLLPGLLLAAGAEVRRQWRTDPARRTPPTLAIHPNGRPDAEVRRAVRAARGRGWRAAVGPAVRPGEVGVALVAPDRSRATDFDPGWPLAVTAADLEAGPVWDRLTRRDEVQRRREVFRGLAVLLKRASRGAAGGGVWFAPHWWLNGGLMRDRPAGRPGPPRRVGPPFARVYEPRTLQHLHAVLRAVELDLVYLEDGVSRKQFDRVLRAVFELYDIHGGCRPAEDRHFVGLPRVRVVVHAYAPGGGTPARAGRYRERQFHDLTRARVLHVFRDDNGVRADIPVPFDRSGAPSPALGLG